MARRLAHITDHALLRYLERVKGVDVAAARREITENVDLVHDHEGATGVIKDGFVYKMNGTTVVTVIEHHCADKQGRKVRA